MSRELISRKTRNEFREYFTSMVLREIEMEFDAADVVCDLDYRPSVSGARRALVEQYYHSIDFSSWNDVRKLLVVYQNVLIDLEEKGKSDFSGYSQEWARKLFSSLLKWLQQDGYQFVNGVLSPTGRSIHLVEVSSVAAKLDALELHRQIDRISNSVEDDPALAIGTAKELLETTCKTILEARGVKPELNWDVTELVKRTRKLLSLLPEDIPDSTRGADVIRKLLSNLGTIAQGLAELRNLYGTGHGGSSQRRVLSARHARLAVGAATTLAVFLFETHEQREEIAKAIGA